MRFAIAPAEDLRMKRKLQLSSFDSPAAEELKITITRLLGPTTAAAEVVCRSLDVPTVILTRTFARGVGLEGKIRWVSP